MSRTGSAGAAAGAVQDRVGGAGSVRDGRAGRPDRFARVPWGAVAVFVVVACGLAWAVAIPLWSGGIEAAGSSGLFIVVASAMMYTPAVATAVAVLLLRAPGTERMRLLGMWPLRPAKRVVWFMVASLVAPALLVLASLGVAVACGWARLDLVEFSGFSRLLEQQLAALDPATAEAAIATMPPLGLLVALQLAMIPIGTLANAVLAFGEEVGWRGWLLPALRPLGTWPALLASGAIWGLWHTPLILLGYNFERTDWTGVALMTVGCVAWGMFFGWLRLRSGSLWPAVLAHGSLNAAAGIVFMLADADSPMDMALVNPLGVSGWIVLAVVAVALQLTGQLRRQPELAADHGDPGPGVAAAAGAAPPEAG